MIETIKDQQTIEGAAKAIATTRKADAARKRKKRASSRTPGTPGPSKTKFTVATEMLAALGDKEELAVIAKVAGKHDLAVVSKADVKKIKSKAEAKPDVPPEPKELMVQFLAMRAQDKVMFVRQCADHIGFTVTDPFEGKHKDGDTGGVPASMKRTA